jgi:dihydroorotate dehydrogenase electron transfer subunit
MRAIEIIQVRRESPDMVSLFFQDELCSKAYPGQYAMIWLPKDEEIPMSLSSINSSGISSLTVKEVGDTTRKLCRIKVGDRIGLRGPFGKGYKLKGKTPLLVAGGSGVASLKPLAEAFIERGLKPTFVLGAKTESKLPFRSELEELLGSSLILATDDGTCGFNGFSSQCAEVLIQEKSFDSIYVCGPELMMVSVFNYAETLDIPVQASLERFIKCAHGLCGSCAIGPYRVCLDGPVFDSEKLREVLDVFGIQMMDSTGRTRSVDIED